MGRVVGRVAVGDECVDAVVGSPQEDEEELLHATVGTRLPDGPLGKGAFHDERNVRDGGQGRAEAHGGRACKEGTTRENLRGVHGLEDLKDGQDAADVTRLVPIALGIGAWS